MKSIKPGAMPLLHGTLATLLLTARIMFRGAVKDAHCGLRAITREAYERLRCVTTGMEFASEMIVNAIRCRLRIAEHDIIYHPRLGEQTALLPRRLAASAFHDPVQPDPDAADSGPCRLVDQFCAGLAPMPCDAADAQKQTWGIHTMLLVGMLNIASAQVLIAGLGQGLRAPSGLHRDPVVAWFYKRFTFEAALPRRPCCL